MKTCPKWQAPLKSMKKHLFHLVVAHLVSVHTWVNCRLVLKITSRDWLALRTEEALDSWLPFNWIQCMQYTNLIGFVHALWGSLCWHQARSRQAGKDSCGSSFAWLLHGEIHLLRATHEQTRIQKRSKIVTDCFPSDSSECSSAHPAI